MSHRCYFLPSVPLTLSLQLKRTDTGLWIERKGQYDTQPGRTWQSSQREACRQEILLLTTRNTSWTSGWSASIRLWTRKRPRCPDPGAPRINTATLGCHRTTCGSITKVRELAKSRWSEQVATTAKRVSAQICQCAVGEGGGLFHSHTVCDYVDCVCVCVRAWMRTPVKSSLSCLSCNLALCHKWAEECPKWGTVNLLTLTVGVTPLRPPRWNSPSTTRLLFLFMCRSWRYLSAVKCASDVLHSSYRTGGHWQQQRRIELSELMVFNKQEAANS